MQEKTEDKPIKRMADLLRQGATLTDLMCPACAYPLFRLKDGTLWCANDEKKVIVIKESEEAEKASRTAYNGLEVTLLSKVQEIQKKIEQTENVEELQKLTTALSELLSTLEKIQKMKSVSRNPEK